jgi:hypothetical protein
MPTRKARGSQRESLACQVLTSGDASVFRHIGDTEKEASAVFSLVSKLGQGPDKYHVSAIAHARESMEFSG